MRRRDFRPAWGFAVLHRNIVRLAVPVAAATLALSACSSSSGGGSKGGSSSSGGGGGTTVTIGLQAPLSGANAQLGINVKYGVQLAFDEFNAKSGNKFKVKLVTSDDEGDPSKANAAATQLISNNDVKAVIGPVFSGPTKASEPLYSSAKLLSISPSATNPTLTTSGFTSFLRGIANDNLQGKAMSDYITQKLHAKKVYVIDDKSEYGVGLADVARKSLKAAGVTVVSDSVPAQTPDYSSPAAKVVNSKADALIYAGYYADAAPLAKKLKDAGWTKPTFSDDGSKDQKLIDNGGQAVEGWYLTCPCTDPTVQASTKSFATAYQTKFKQAPSTYSGESYDIANMLLSEIGKLGAGADRAAILGAMQKADYKGITKEFSFDAKGEFKGTDVWLYQVKNQKVAFVGNVKDLLAG